MRDNVIKTLVRNLFFPDGGVRRVIWGPVRGMTWRVNGITGIAPVYSGAERDHQNAFRRHVRPGNVVMDVGANWGLHSLLLARLVGGQGQVIAFEPFLPALSELEWHLRQNGVSNATVCKFALSDCNGTGHFIAGTSASTGALAGSVAQAGDGEEQITVSTRTLDSVVEELSLARLDLMKIDVEGAECRVLRGGVTTIERFRPVLIIDLHTPEQDMCVAEWLIGRDYELARLSGPPIRRTDKGWPDGEGVWGSIIALPKPS